MSKADLADPTTVARETWAIWVRLTPVWAEWIMGEVKLVWGQEGSAAAEVGPTAQISLAQRIWGPSEVVRIQEEEEGERETFVTDVSSWIRFVRLKSWAKLVRYLLIVLPVEVRVSAWTSSWIEPGPSL